MQPFRKKPKKPDSIANSEQNSYIPSSNGLVPDFDYHSEPVYSSTKPFGKPKAIVTLNIGNSLEQIRVYEGQDLYALASEFAEKHDLNEEFIGFLVSNIQTQLNERANKSFISTARIPEQEHNAMWQKMLTSREDKSFSSTYNRAPDQEQNIKEQHYENWQRILNQKLIEKNQGKSPQIVQPSQGKNNQTSSPYRKRSVSPIRNAALDTSGITEKLFNESKILKKKQENFEVKKQENELKECSFQPKISSNSQKLVQRDRSAKTIHEKLYEETSIIQANKEKQTRVNLEKNYPFRPEISPSRNEKEKGEKKQQIEVVNRLVNSKKVNMKKQMIQMEEKEKSPFTPKITKDKYWERAKAKEELELENYSNTNIAPSFVKGLSNNSLKPNKNPPKPIQNPTKPIQNHTKPNQNIVKPVSNTPKSIQNSTKTTQNPENLFQKNNKIQQISSKPSIFDQYLAILKENFSRMDDDQDGWISSERIDLGRLDPGFLEIIQNVLLQVDEQKVNLDFTGFLNKIEENHLEVPIHNWMSNNFTEFKQLDSFYESMTPKHVQQFSFGGSLESGFEMHCHLNEKKEINNNNNNEDTVKVGQLTSRYKDLVRTFD